MGELSGRTAFITGGSRGIGLAIAVALAREGANVAIAAKTVEPHPALEGTIHTAADAIAEAGGQPLALACDIREVDQIEAAVAETLRQFGGIDICINNASAISLTPLKKTEPKRFDLMMAVNTRGTLFTTKTCVPHLVKSDNPHVLCLSPPLDMRAKWFSGHVAYSIAKYGMSLCVLGLADELRAQGIAVNALWPRTTIATAAVRNILGGDALVSMSRKPEIMGDAALLAVRQPAGTFTGNFLIDDSFLAEEGGVTDFERYRVDASKPLAPDFFVPDTPPPPRGVDVMPIERFEAALRGTSGRPKDTA